MPTLGIQRLTVPNEKRAAGLVQSLLMGHGPQVIDAGKRLVSPAGAVLDEVLKAKRTPPTGAVSNILGETKRLLVGERPGEILSQRMDQGGLFGKGGVIRGSMAYHPDFVNALSQRGLGSAIKEHPKRFIGGTMNNAFGVGFPLAAAIPAALDGDAEGLGGAAGQFVGNALTGPMGLVGNTVGFSGGEAIGRAITRAVGRHAGSGRLQNMQEQPMPEDQAYQQPEQVDPYGYY